MDDADLSAPTVQDDRLRNLRRALADPFDLAALVSLAVLVPSPQRAGVVGSVVLAVLAAAVVIAPVVRRAWWPWAIFAVFHVVTYVTQWYLLDNHDALVAYWAVALTLAAAGRGRAGAVATQARLMLGVTFGFATMWKVLSSQFRSGDFFTFALLVDPRFRGVTEMVAGVPVDHVRANVDALSDASQAWQGAPAVALLGAEAVGWIALLLTVGTIVVEAGVAIAMLVPDTRTSETARSVLLGAFLVATYAIVPVSRFGVLLAAMGVAQASSRPRLRGAFAVGAVVLVIWGSVWMQVVGLA